MKLWSAVIGLAHSSFVWLGSFHSVQVVIAYKVFFNTEAQHINTTQKYTMCSVWQSLPDKLECNLETFTGLFEMEMPTTIFHSKGDLKYVCKMYRLYCTWKKN